MHPQQRPAPLVVGGGGGSGASPMGSPPRTGAGGAPSPAWPAAMLERAPRPSTAGSTRSQLSGRSQHASPAQPSGNGPISSRSTVSRPTSAASWGANRTDASGWTNGAAGGARSLGMSTGSGPAPLTPFTPNVPYNSFTPFTGPYAYLAHNVPQQASANAHIDWLRLEVLRRDIQVMSATIRAGLDHQQAKDEAKRHTVPASVAPTYAPLPLPLLTQLGGVAFLHTLSTRALKTAEECKDVDASDSVVGRDEWEGLVSRAVQRFGHSSDYLQSLTSTVGLLEVWAVQVSRMADTATWMSERALQRCNTFKAFAATTAARRDAPAHQRPAEQQLFSFSTTIRNLMPVPVPHSLETNGEEGPQQQQAMMGNSSSTSSLALAAPSSLSESSLFHALPSLAQLLERLQLLTRFAAWAENQLAVSKSAVDASQKEQRTLVAEMAILADAVKEAARDRPKTKRVIHEHVHVTVARPAPAPTAEAETPPVESTPVKRTRPASAFLPRQSTRPVSPPPAAAPPASSTSADDAATITSLQHEVWLLRQSLEAERTARVAAVDSEAGKVADEMAELRAQLEEVTNKATESEQAAASASAALAAQTEAFSVASKRMTLDTSSHEVAALAKARAEMDASSEHLWAERLAAERAHRDRVEKERWELHIKAADELKQSWNATLRELAAAREELDVLRRASTTSRSAAEERRTALLEQQERAERDRAAEQAASAREEARVKAFEAELAARRAKLEKEMKAVARESESAMSKAAAAGAAAVEEERSRLRREKAHLEEQMEQAKRRETQRKHEWLAHGDVVAALRADLTAATEAGKTAAARLERAEGEHAAAAAKLAKQLAAAEEAAATLRARGQQADQGLGDARATLVATTAELAALRVERERAEEQAARDRERLVQLESELESCRDALRLASQKAQTLESTGSSDQATARKLADQQGTVVRGLEARLAELQAQLAFLGGASSNTPSRSPSSARLLASPSSSSSNLRSPTAAARSRPTTPNPTASRDEHARKDLEQQWTMLKSARGSLTSAEADAAEHRAILAQQRAELAEEQRLLATSASLLHSQLLHALQTLLPLKFATVSKLAEAQAQLPHTEQQAPITLAGVDALRDAVREHTEITDAIHSNIGRELRTPATALHQDSLSARLEALRRACEFHEQRLVGLAPMPSPGAAPSSSTPANHSAAPARLLTPAASARASTSSLSPAASPTPKRVLFGAFA